MLARLSRSVATVGIAAGLVFAVPISSADALGSPGVGLLVQGAIRAAAPAAAASIVGGPGASLVVGTVATVGSLLYMTKDTWVPWVQGAFGEGGTGTALSGMGGWTVDSVTVDGSPGGVWAVTSTKTGGVWSQSSRKANITCKLAGVVTTGSYANVIFLEAGHESETLSGQCGGGGSVIGLQTVSNYADSGVPDPSNFVSWGVPFNPLTEAEYDVDVKCRKGDGTIATITATTTSPGAGNGLMVPSCVQAFGPDAHGEKVALRAGPNGMAKTDQWSADWGGAGATYPNCVGAGVACTYVVKYLGQPCVAGQAECINWSLRSQVEGNTDYSCWYGPYLLTLADCAISERAYEANPNRLTKLNTDGDALTYEEPRPSWLPAPAPAPLPQPGTPLAGAPGGAPAPVPGAQLVPTQTQTNNVDCWPSGGAAWNPAEWVLQPIKCALTWTFVPSPVFMDSWGNGFRDSWGTSPPGLWINSVGGLTPEIAGAGCQGPALSTGFLSNVPKLGAVMPAVIHPFDACSGVMATVAATSYLILTAGISFYGGMKVVRQLGYAFGFQVHIGSERSTFT